MRAADFAKEQFSCGAHALMKDYVALSALPGTDPDPECAENNTDDHGKYGDRQHKLYQRKTPAQRGAPSIRHRG
jgi:hypothetical protein